MELEASSARSGLVAIFFKQYFVSLLIVVSTFFALRLFMEWIRKYMLLKNVPGPDDRFPPKYIIDLLKPKEVAVKKMDVTAVIAKELHNVIDTYADPFEGVCKFYLGFTPLVLFSRVQSAETILADHINVSKTLTYTFLERYIPQSMLTATGEFWRFQRKLLTPAFHFNIIDDFMEIFNRHAASFVVHLNKFSPDEEVLLFRETSKCTINVVGETALGHDVDAMSGDNPYGRALTQLQTLILLRTTQPWMWIDWLYYRFTKDGARYIQAVETMRGLSERILDIKMAEKKEEIKAAKLKLPPPEPAKKKLRTLVEILLDSHTKNPQLVPRWMCQVSVDGVLFAGQDTTAATLSWAMFLLGHNLDAQEKCRQELFAVLGPDRDAPVTPNNIRELKYLEACIKESMRVYAPVPLIGRQLETDLKVKGNGKTYTIPKGVQVVTSIFHVHRDPKYFPDPEKFIPERFLDENAPHKAHPYAYVPFSGGPRNCMGRRFALVQLKVTLAHLLRHLKWRSTVAREDLNICFEIVLRAKGDLRIKVEPLGPAEYVGC